MARGRFRLAYSAKVSFFVIHLTFLFFGLSVEKKQNDRVRKQKAHTRQQITGEQPSVQVGLNRVGWRMITGPEIPSAGSALLHALTRRAHGGYLLRGQGPKSLSNQVRMALDHIFPAFRFHNLSSVPVKIKHTLKIFV